MKKYIINEIYSDGYERFAMIEEVGKNVKINVHFLEYDEYSVYALSSILDDNVLVVFENAVSYKVGEQVLVIGSLELSEIS